jgi:methylase of polypeptide subunit release factors
MDSMPDLERFRLLLEERGYRDDHIAQLTGRMEFVPGETVNTRFFRHRLGADPQLAPISRFFLLGEPLPAPELAAALAPIPLAEWAQAGLLALDGETARPEVCFQSTRGLLLACDNAALVRRPDQVMGVTQSTMLLADFTIRRPVDSLLDIGTGTGIQAFLARGHARHLVATDTSPRALQFARLNASLNSVANLELLPGSAFEPVAGRRFDQIVTNPPFFISPSRSLVFRDSGCHLDGFAEALIRHAHHHLTPGGYCQLEFNWVERKGEDWSARLASWVEGTGCDLWVLHIESILPDQYARDWISETEPEAAGRYDDWVSFYDRERIEHIHSGLAVLRHSGAASPRVRIDELPSASIGAFGDAVELGFRLDDYLARTSDATLAGETLRLAPNTELQQRAHYEDGRWVTESAEIRQRSGLGFNAGLDRNSLGFVTDFDGRRTLGEILAHYPPAAHAPCLGIARHLVGRGFLLPSSV